MSCVEHLTGQKGQGAEESLGWSLDCGIEVGVLVVKLCLILSSVEAAFAGLPLPAAHLPLPAWWPFLSAALSSSPSSLEGSPLSPPLPTTDLSSGLPILDTYADLSC